MSIIETIKNANVWTLLLAFALGVTYLIQHETLRKVITKKFNWQGSWVISVSMVLPALLGFVAIGYLATFNFDTHSQYAVKWFYILGFIAQKFFYK